MNDSALIVFATILGFAGVFSTTASTKYLSSNAPSMTSFKSDKSKEDNATCYTVKMKDGSLTYCNVTTVWKPLVKKSQALAAGFIITILALVFIVYGFCRSGKTFTGLCCKCRYNASCYALSNFVVTAVLRILWKIIDISIDVLTFYKLGIGELIDNGIYRNPHVLYSLLAFTCLGVVAMLASLRLIYLKSEDLKEYGDVQTLKLLMVLIAFILEDSVQMFLEYYWIQKYVTVNVPVYLIIKDIIIAIIAFHSLLCSVWVLKSECSTRKDYIFFAFGVIVSLAEMLRVGAVVTQYRNGIFNYDCLHISNDDGKLWQTPFDSNCMKTIDYFILILTFLPFGSLPFIVAAFRSDIQKLHFPLMNKR